ncbi:MAG: CvpA family protein [Bacteroidetes bacterium]|nr:CvpA family protein [Bacteroidota bacterium]
MNYIDLILLILILISGIFGFIKGFIRSLGSLVSLIAGVWAALNLSYLVRDIIVDIWDYQGKFIQPIAFIITFLVVAILIRLIARLLDKGAEAVSLGFFNEILGAFFGMIKALLILSVLIYLIEMFNLDTHIIPQEDAQKSVVYRQTRNIFPFLMKITGTRIKGWQPVADPAKPAEPESAL